MSNACGMALASARRFAGLTLREASAAVGFSVSYIHECERGTRHHSSGLIIKLARLYGADVATLLVLHWQDIGEVRLPVAALEPDELEIVALAASQYTPPAEAARDAACDGRDSPPSAPVASESRVASARRTKVSPTATSSPRTSSTRWCTPREDSFRGRE